MADFLALDWDAQQVCGVAAQVGRKSVRVKKCFFGSWPEGIDPVTKPAEAGAWLKQQLSRAGIDETDAILSLPREAVSVKPLQLPNVPDEELADAVRLQAATRSPLPLDQLLMDYIPVAAASGAAGRRVLVATLPKAVFERASRLAEAAGVKFVGADMTPLGVTTIVRRATRYRASGAEGLTLVVSTHGQRVEILLLSQHSLVFSYATTVYGSDQQERSRALSIEVDRCLIAAESEGAAAGLKVERVWLLGGDGDNSQLVAALEKRFSCSVSTSLDPLADAAVSGDTSSAAGDHWNYAPAIGLLLNRAGCGGESIDFLNPRKAIVKRGRGKMRAGMVAAGVLALFGAGFAAVKMEESSLDKKIDAKSKQKADLDKKIAEGKDALDSAKTMERWLETDLNWVDEFRKLKASFDASNGIFLSDFKVSPPTRGELLSCRATGFARKEQDVRALYQKLHEQNYRVMPYATPQANKADQEYPFQFDLMVELVRGTKSPATATTPADTTKSDAKKTDDKKTDDKKAEDLKSAEKKPEDKKTDAAKPAEAKTDDKKTEDKKPDEKKSEEKKPEEKKGDEKKPEDQKPADSPKAEETKQAPETEKSSESTTKEATQPAAEPQAAPATSEAAGDSSK